MVGDSLDVGRLRAAILSGILIVALSGCTGLSRSASESSRSGDTGRSHVRRTAYPLTAIEFADDRNGWAVGAQGAILRTADAGAVWNEQSSGVSAGLNAIDVEGPQVAVVVGDRGTILVTRDGGASWVGHDDVTSEDLYSVQLLPSGVGFAAGGTQSAGVLLMTRDGARTWSRVPTNVESLRRVLFADARHGVAIGIDGTVSLESSDGGKTWTRHRLPLINTNYWMLGLDIRKSGAGLICGGEEFGVILRTVDAGRTWSSVDVHDTRAVNDVCMVSDTEAWAVGDSGAAFHTMDGGDTWRYVPTETTGSLSSIDITEEGAVWTVGCDDSAASGVLMQVSTSDDSR